MTDEQLDAALRSLAEEIRLPDASRPEAGAVRVAPPPAPTFTASSLAVWLAAAAVLLMAAAPALRSLGFGSAASGADLAWPDPPSASSDPIGRSVAQDLRAASHPDLLDCLDRAAPFDRWTTFSVDLPLGIVIGARADASCVRSFGERPEWAGLRTSLTGADLRLWPWERQRSLAEGPREHVLVVTMPEGSDAVLGFEGFEFHRLRGGGTFEIETGGLLYMVPYGRSPTDARIRIGPIVGARCTWTFPEPGGAVEAPVCR